MEESGDFLDRKHKESKAWAYWEKDIVRVLRHNFGERKDLDRKWYLYLKATYLACVEIFSDNAKKDEKPVTLFSFQKSLKTYAGLSINITNICLRVLQKLYMISTTKSRDRRGTVLALKKFISHEFYHQEMDEALIIIKAYEEKKPRSVFDPVKFDPVKFNKKEKVNRRDYANPQKLFTNQLVLLR